MSENTHLNTVNEAKARLRLGRSKVYEEIASGRLRSVKVGSRRLIPESALIEFMDALTDANVGA